MRPPRGRRAAIKFCQRRNILYLVLRNNYDIMKYRFLILIAALGLMSCASVRSTKVQFRSLSVEKFAKYIERQDVMLVDVRTSEEYAAGHIVGVDDHIDVKGASFFEDYKRLPKDRPIAVYCRGGGRSKQVAGVLAGNGYNVVELSGGYNAWVEAGCPTEE